MEKEECSTCRRWDLEYRGNKPCEVSDLPHGQCLNALEYWDGESSEIKSRPMVTLDGSCYMAILMTLPNHSCKEWVAK